MISADCGNGTFDAGEDCEDGNTTAGDCCSPGCRAEADCACQPMVVNGCSSTAICGNGLLSSIELCDDMNTTPGDGCSATCTVEPGYQCRVPGKKCVPDCGDGMVIGGENCDDGNEASMDGCSATCLVEPGWSCPAGGTCVQSVCGNSMTEAGESCDKGADNGLFYGDGMGCSKTCTQEPNCRPNGTTQACTTRCGDGNRDVDEECDDGNQSANDGCSPTCVPEGGFVCSIEPRPDTQACPSAPSLQCLVLPVIYRDFEGQQVAGGHPDFFYMGAPVSGGRTTGVTPGATKTTCVPNAGGAREAWVPGDACTNSDATGPCTGLVGATLDPQGKPTLANNTCPCVFTEWDVPAGTTGVLNGVTGVQQCWVENEGSQRNRVEGTVTVIQDATSFGQWYTTSAMSTESRGTLELAAMGANYQFSSSRPGAVAGTAGRIVNQDIHDNCLGMATPLQSGFFPLEAAAGTKICNVWPYWAFAAGTTRDACRAGTGYTVLSQWDPQAAYDACPTAGTGGPVPRSDGTGTAIQGEPRNFYFTTEARYLFRYAGTPATLAFYGDDDVWVFVNGQLALDLGAPHQQLPGMVQITNAFGLEMGKVYEIAVFHADRHPRESNYQLTLSGFATERSVCVPRCGDGVATATEECDLGDGLNTGEYGGCTADCKYGPFCGDAVTNGPEQCDLGSANGSTVYLSPTDPQEGCTLACTLPHRCGDGIIDGDFGEECDDGPTTGGDCDGCKIGPPA